MRKQDSSVDKMLFACVLISALTALSLAEQCVKVDSCTCKTSTREYSLHSLSSPEGPRFDAKYGNDHYYYNPCKDFSKQGAQGSQPITGVIIQYQGSSYYALGDDASAAFTGDPDLGTLKLTYTHKDPSGSTRTSDVSIQCVPGVNDFTFEEEKPTLTYHFTLRTDVWCPATDTGLSVGSILVILFFVFLIVYIVAGILFLKFVRRAEGLELVPNFEFWKALPPLIRDGCFFTFRGCKAESTYEKI